jgi:lysine 2,3-aminomutase
VDRDVRGDSPRGPWTGVPEAEWTDWRWQQRHRLTTLADLEAVVELTPSERRAFALCSDKFRVAVTPYYAALMDPRDPECPIRRQAIPRPEELEIGPEDLLDPLGEERFMPVPGLTHRYPDRALLYVTHHCPVYCRHCTRKRKVSDPTSTMSRTQLEDAVAYLAAHAQIRDVLVSGGDPLTLSDDRLVAILEALTAIPHIEVIRLCTRNPVTLPFRLTDALLDRMAPSQPLLVHTQFNHPAECTPEAARCLRRLADRGFSTANQMVLLRGINDDAETVREVNHWLLRQRCRPYYLFQADLAEGVSHFRTPLETGVEIIRALRGHTSGMAVPHFVIDAPGGGGKIPLVPDYEIERTATELVFENYEGETYRYPLK